MKLNVKRFMVMVHSRYYPNGGFSDLKTSVDSVSEIKNIYNAIDEEILTSDEDYITVDILDTKTMEIQSFSIGYVDVDYTDNIMGGSDDMSHMKKDIRAFIKKCINIGYGEEVLNHEQTKKKEN